MSTKKLARELGLIRKHSQTSSAQKKPTSKQLFSYLIVIDFESTCWREKNSYGQEIIEFPAVLLNTSNGEIESEFHSYVQPQEHPVLSDFCTELTGITQKQVEAGLPLRICLARFARWLHSLQQDKGVVCVTDGQNPPASGHLCTFLTWSDWDLGVCLLYECKRKQISKPEALNSWIDLRATYRTFYSRKPKGLNGALQDLGIQFSGREHSGLDDARNTARLAWRMMTDGCVLKVTKSLSRAPLKSRPRFVHCEGQTNPHTSVGENQPSPDSGNHSNMNSAGGPNSSVGVRSLVSTRTVLSALVTPVWVNTPQLTTTLQNTTHSSPPHTTSHPDTSDCDWSEGHIVTEAGESGSYDDVVLEDEDCVHVDENSVPLNIRPHPFKPHPSETRPSTSAPLPPLSDPYRSLTRPGRLHTTTTPSMPFNIYTDQSEHSSSTGGLFKVPHSVTSSSVRQTVRPSRSNNQSKLLSSSINQSALSNTFHNQSALSNTSHNQSALSNTFHNQSALSNTSHNQSALSNTFHNQSALSNTSHNQSALSNTSHNQSALHYTSIKQSKQPSTSVNQSAVSYISTDQSARSSCSVNQSALTTCSNNQSKLPSSSVNQSALPDTSTNQSAPSYTSSNQSALPDTSTNQSAPSYTSSNQSALPDTSTNQSAPSYTSSNQSALPDTSTNQSAPSYTFSNQSALPYTSTNQSAPSYSSSNRSKQPPGSTNQLFFSSVSSNQSKCSSISNQSALTSCSGNQSKLSSTSVNQSALAYTSSNQSARCSISNNQSALASCSTNLSKRSSMSFNQSALSSISVNQSALSSISVSSGGRGQRLCKVTSPLCGCGRRARRLTVCNGGPNHGRAFFTCPARRSGSSSPAHAGGCGFFKWESAVMNSSMKQNSISFNTVASRSFR